MITVSSIKTIIDVNVPHSRLPQNLNKSKSDDDDFGFLVSIERAFGERPFMNMLWLVLKACVSKAIY